jgi:hypothetical protein
MNRAGRWESRDGARWIGCRHLADKAAFKVYLAPLHRTKWFVYCKRPFAGPEQVLAYLSRYTPSGRDLQ